MKKIVLWGSILFAFILTGAGLSSAISCPLMVPMSKWWERSSISKKLHLKDQEKEALHKLLIEKKSKLIDLEAKVKKWRLKLEDMIEDKNMDENAARNVLNALSKARSDLIRIRLEYVLGVRKILGFERFEILKEAMMIKFKKPAKQMLKHKHMGHHKHGGKWTK